MAKKEFIYRGIPAEQLKKLSTKDFAKLAKADVRRKISRGFTDQEQILLKRIEAGDKNIKTHVRTLPVLPSMIGATLKIYNGKTFEDLVIEADMVGHYLGEFALSRRRVAHNSPGIGATKSSAGAKK